MDDKSVKVIVTDMNSRSGINWSQGSARKNRKQKRLTRNRILLPASFALIALGGAYTVLQSDVKPVMGQMSTGFQYDESLGRLQFVSSILPESAMVFLQTDNAMDFLAPTGANMTHEWQDLEPWLEYATYEEIAASADGEVMSVISNRDGEHTVRILHQDGYESIMSGLCDVTVAVGDMVECGQRIGVSSGLMGYELRKDGLSICPVFADSEGE